MCFAAVFPVQQPVVTNSSSSEDEAVESVPTVVRRRRLRKNTTSVVAEPEEEALESGHSECKDVNEEVHQKEQAEPQPCVTPPPQGHVGRTLNKCILLALVISIIIGFGHFYGKCFWVSVSLKS